jgi:ubiquinone/menaquinone biosynthesis C-methylase UbiE
MNLDIGTLDERTKRTWNATYEAHKKPNFWGATAVPFVARAIDTFKADAATMVLDLPCGDGRNLMPLVNEFPFVVGADASRNALEVASVHLAQAGAKNCLFEEVDIFKTPFVGDQFDGIFCADVLGHLTQPATAITELLRICRRGKCIVASFVALSDSTRGSNMKAIGPEEYLYDDKFYFKFYDQRDVVHLLDHSEVDIMSIEIARWIEPPHKGYREYEHEHQSWICVMKKR